MGQGKGRWITLASDHGQCVLTECPAVWRFELELTWLKHLLLVTDGTELHTEHRRVQLDRYQIAIDRVSLTIQDIAPDFWQAAPFMAEVLLRPRDQYVVIGWLRSVRGRWRLWG